MDADIRALTPLLEEARRHLDVQIEAYRDVDARAVAVVRLGALLLGIGSSLAGVLIGTRAVSGAPSWVAPTLLAGVLTLSTSVASGAIAFTRTRLGTGIRGFVSAADVPELGPELVVRFILDVYDRMIEDNRRVIERKNRLVDAALLLLVGGLVPFTTGVVGLFVEGA